MATRLTTEQKEGMFIAYCEKPNVLHVAKKCKVSATTVKRHRDKYDWDKRKEAVDVKRRARVEYDIIKETTRHIEIIDKVITKFEDKIPDRISVKDYIEVTKLKLLLMGEPDSRIDLGISDAIRELDNAGLRELITNLRSRTSKA